MEKSKVQQAIEARNKKRASVQAAADSRKADAMTKRRGYASKGTTTMGAGTGIGIMKYVTPTTEKKATRFYTPAESAANARQYEMERSDRRKPVAKGPTTAKKRAASMAAPSVSTPAKSKPLGLGVAGMSKVAPKGMNVTPGRTYTDKEKQINALLMTGKKKDGTMKASAQRKIQNIRKK